MSGEINDELPRDETRNDGTLEEDLDQAFPEPPADPVWEAIQEWLGSRIHNSPVSQSTPAYNHLVSQLPVLRDMINRRL